MKHRQVELRLLNTQRGFTLVELVLVIIIIGLISLVAVNRLDSVQLWKAETDLRSFASTWAFLFNESFSRGESYVLILDLDEQCFFVRREALLEQGQSKNVDLLANLRIKSEAERIKQRKESEENLTLDEEFSREDARLAKPVDELFYAVAFSDPSAETRLALPLEFPELAEKYFLSSGIRIIGVETEQGKINSGQVFLHLAGKAGSELASVHFKTESQSFTVVNNPATGKVRVLGGEHELVTKK